MTIYLDVLFLINFIMDYIIITLASILSAVRITRAKKCLSALLAAGLGILHFIFHQKAAASLLFGLFIPPAAVASALGRCKGQVYLRCLICYSAATFLLSGAAAFALSLLGVGSVTSPVIYLIAVLVLVITKSTIAMLRSGALKGTHQLTVRYGKRIATRTAALDTGNSLTEPLTNRPVIVADEALISELFGCGSAGLAEWLEPTDMRIIPYKTIDKTGVMTGFVPTSVTVDGRLLPDCVIAISPKEISGGVLLNNAII